MLIIGCDFHTRFQQIAMVDTTTGDVVERRLEHERGEARKFYATLSGPARVGMEATLASQWFEKMLSDQGHELWVGDPAKIRARMVRKQKTNSRDALHILDLLLTNRFPRIWIPSPAERDVRQLLRHRHKLVRFQTSVMNQLHALAMGQGLCRKKKLWTTVGRKELEGLALDPWARRRRRELLQLLDQLAPWIEELDRAVIQEAESRPEAILLMKHPGVGPVTALAFVLTIGPVERFPTSKQVVSYLGLNPSEGSSADRQRLGATLGFAAIIVSTSLFFLYITNDTVVLEALRQRAGSGKMPEWWAPLRSHFTIVGDVEVALTYLAIAAFATALRSVGRMGRIASRVVVGVSLIAVPLVALLPLYPSKLALPGFVLGIPAVPFVMPYLIGVNLLRGAGDTFT